MHVTRLSAGNIIREEVSCIRWDVVVETSDEVSDAEIITEPSFWKALQALFDDILP